MVADPTGASLPDCESWQQVDSAVTRSPNAVWAFGAGHGLLLGLLAAMPATALWPERWGPPLVAFAVPMLVLVYRGATVGVRLTPTQVTIRNLYRTHVLNRAEVAEWILVDVHVWGQPAVAQCVGARVGGGEIKALGTFRLGDRGGDRMLRFFGVPLD